MPTLTLARAAVYYREEDYAHQAICSPHDALEDTPLAERLVLKGDRAPVRRHRPRQVHETARRLHREEHASNGLAN
jgi:hypothetical protein